MFKNLFTVLSPAEPASLESPMSVTDVRSLGVTLLTVGRTNQCGRRMQFVINDIRWPHCLWWFSVIYVLCDCYHFKVLNCHYTDKDYISHFRANINFSSHSQIEKKVMRIHREDVGKELHLFSIIVVFVVQLSKFQNYHYPRIPDSLGKQIFHSTMKSHFSYAYVFHRMCLSKNRFQERSKLILVILLHISEYAPEWACEGR